MIYRQFLPSLLRPVVLIPHARNFIVAHSRVVSAFLGEVVFASVAYGRSLPMPFSIIVVEAVVVWCIRIEVADVRVTVVHPILKSVCLSEDDVAVFSFDS